MCLQVHIYPHTITQPLKVYKILKLRTHVSPYQEFKYRKNTRYELDKPLRVTRSSWSRVNEIWEGFHAFVDIAAARNEQWLLQISTKIVEFTIPAGATVAYGISGDIVSDIVETESLRPVRK